jgi:hypothetical protein
MKTDHVNASVTTGIPNRVAKDKTVVASTGCLVAK